MSLLSKERKTSLNTSYSDNNELKQVSLPGVGAITYPSYTWTRPDSVSYPGGGARTYTYDPLMRLRRLLASDPGGNALLDVQYQYDRLNNILTKTTPQGTVNYTYDAISRLTGVQVETPTAGQPDEGFTYDRVGNRTTEEGIEGEWGYNANNELLTFANTAYTYDANGNTTQVTLDGTVMFSYHYNTFDRLVQVDDVNGAVLGRYYYDPFGRRLWKQAGDETTLFFYSDEGLVAEYDPTGAEIRSYGYRPDSTWTTDPLWLEQDGEYCFYHNDHLGTPQQLVKQNGAVVWSASSTAFGQATVEVETVTNNLRFPGQYYDVEIGLHYNWMRYYDFGTGKYLQTDPIGLQGGINVFSYGNNPIIFMDPWGLACCTSRSECFNKCFSILNPDPFKTVAKILYGIVEHVGDWHGGLEGTAGDLEQLPPYGAGLGGWIAIRKIIDRIVGGHISDIKRIPIPFIRRPWKFPIPNIGPRSPYTIPVGKEIIWTWKLSTMASCTVLCQFDRCYYDIVGGDEGWFVFYLIVEGSRELYYNVKGTL